MSRWRVENTPKICDDSTAGKRAILAEVYKFYGLTEEKIKVVEG